MFVANYRLFIVPGNHDVDRDATGRDETIRRICFQRNGYYDPKYGKIEEDDLKVVYSGQEEFREFLSKIYTADRMAKYANPLNPHFNVETENFNILHIDSTLTYTKDQESVDLVIGTKLLQNALKELNNITIATNNRQRREDLSLQYMPVLTERIVPYAEKTTLCSEITYLLGHPLFDDNDTEFCSQQIELENVGRGEIVNCSIDMMESRLFTASEADLYAIKNDAYILGDGFFQFIPINGKIVLYVAYPKAREWVYEREASLSIETTIEIVIRGIIGEREYRYQLHYFLDLNYEKDEECRSEIRTVTLKLITD